MKKKLSSFSDMIRRMCVHIYMSGGIHTRFVRDEEEERKQLWGRWWLMIRRTVCVLCECEVS